MDNIPAAFTHEIIYVDATGNCHRELAKYTRGGLWRLATYRTETGTTVNAIDAIVENPLR